MTRLRTAWLMVWLLLVGLLPASSCPAAEGSGQATVCHVACRFCSAQVSRPVPESCRCSTRSGAAARLEVAPRLLLARASALLFRIWLAQRTTALRPGRPTASLPLPRPPDPLVLLNLPPPLAPCEAARG